MHGVYVRLLIRVSVSLFMWLFIFVFGYIVTDCTYIGTSLIPRFCISLFPLSFSVSGHIIDNLHVFEQARSGRSMCNSALENLCIIINCAWIRTSIDSYFFLSLWLWMSVPVSGYVMTRCMCICVSWSCLFFLSLWTSVVVFGYIVSHCRCISRSLHTCFYKSLDPYFSVFSLNASICFRLHCHWLSVCRFISLLIRIFIYVSLYQSWYPRILPLSLRVYVHHFTRVSLFLSLNVYNSVSLYYHSFLVYMYVSWFVFLYSVFSDCLYLCSAGGGGGGGCFYPCMAILSLILRAKVRLLIRVSLCSPHPPTPSVFGRGGGGAGMFLSMYGYIVTDSTCKSTSLDPRFSLFPPPPPQSFFFCLSVCVRVYYR